jgi:hypothetical protein
VRGDRLAEGDRSGGVWSPVVHRHPPGWRPPLVQDQSRGGKRRGSRFVTSPELRVKGPRGGWTTSYRRPPAGGVAPPRERAPALAAPGIGELLETPGPEITGPRSNRRRRDRPYSHVHLEIDLAPSPPEVAGAPALERLAEFLRREKVVEQGTLILLAAQTLHALAARRFRRVDHWEITPGGWLPPPRPRAGLDASEPVGELLTSLQSGPWSAAGGARAFSARLSDLSGARLDVTVRRVHREGRHAISLDLWGLWTRASVEALEGSLSKRLRVIRSRMTKFQYA